MKKYYLQTYMKLYESHERVWEVDEQGRARILGTGSDWTYRVEQFDTDFRGAKFYKLKLGPGQYYPRMARPYSLEPEASPGSNPDASTDFRNARSTSSGHLYAMIERLEHLCRVIHPCRDNFETYGHETRNLLILACTEVEAQCKNIMVLNGVPKPYGTKSYAKLAPAMQLGAFGVTLNWYPWLDPIFPFETWEPGENSTRSLPWYHAYNQVKHDRETCFRQATLKNALDAVTGCFVMLCAQNGWDYALKGREGEQAFFRLTSAPKWPPEDIYISGGDLQPIPYFSGAKEEASSGLNEQD